MPTDDTPQVPTLPPRPTPPVDYDCCGGGCADCDLRRYHSDLAAWLRLSAAAAPAAASDAGRVPPQVVFAAIAKD